MYGGDRAEKLRLFDQMEKMRTLMFDLQKFVFCSGVTRAVIENGKILINLPMGIIGVDHFAASPQELQVDEACKNT